MKTALLAALLLVPWTLAAQVDTTQPVCTFEQGEIPLAYWLVVTDEESGFKMMETLRFKHFQVFLVTEDFGSWIVWKHDVVSLPDSVGNRRHNHDQSSDYLSLPLPTSVRLFVRPRLDEFDHGIFYARFTNGAGLSVVCDPVFESLTGETPERFGIESVYPNPFNPETTIRYGVTEAGAVTVKVYDVQGREAATLADGMKQSGVYEARWDGADDAGRALPSGTYLVRIVSGEGVESRVITLLK